MSSEVRVNEVNSVHPNRADAFSDLGNLPEECSAPGELSGVGGSIGGISIAGHVAGVVSWCSGCW
ncbi:MAG: hypothetical protein M9890_06895 [Thermomicrobiales bacterium]|nr:hypothetical protein [Thermomicrobiales bacterium]